MKLNISYGHELINWEMMSEYLDNIGLVPQLIEKLVYAELKTRVPKPKRN